MRVTNVALYSNDVEAAKFTIRESDQHSKYVLRTILGLDADEIIPKFYGFGLVSRPKYYDFGLKAREIVIRVALKPRFHLNETHSDIRDELYRIISSTRTGVVTLHFNSGATTVAKIDGFITKFEAPHFSKLPEVQLTLRCDNPMLRAINPVEYPIGTLPLTNPIILADTLSTAPHGFAARFKFNSSAATFTIQDAPTSPEWKFQVAGFSFALNDTLYFSSDFANKYLYVIRGSTTTQLVNKILPGSLWPVIFPGINEFYIPEMASMQSIYVEYYAAYWGV